MIYTNVTWSGRKSATTFTVIHLPLEELLQALNNSVPLKLPLHVATNVVHSSEVPLQGVELMQTLALLPSLVGVTPQKTAV
jgi:hypothetical protein